MLLTRLTNWTILTFSNRIQSVWAGRASIILLELGPFFLVFRFISMQHHRFTTDEAKDPNAFERRPKSECREFFLSVVLAASSITAITLAGWIEYYLLLFFLPIRIAKLIIVLAFDFLPHFPHETTAKEDPYKSTSTRIGMEWLWTPLSVYQNYHRVHHICLTVLFYRYVRIWNAKKGYHKAQNSATVEALIFAQPLHQFNRFCK